MRAQVGVGESPPAALQADPLSLCPHMVERGERAHWRLFSSKGTNPVMRAPPSSPPLTFVTSSRPYLQIASHWGLGLQRVNLGEGHKY